MIRFVSASGIALLLATALSGCEAMSQAVQSNNNVLARAAGHQLTVDQTVDLLSNQRQLPNRPEVVEALANLWIDYTLLAVAVNRDSSMESFDLAPVVKEEIDQLKVYKLRDSAVRPDTAIGEAELRELFQRELPGARIHARHILLKYPDQATEEQRDSVMELAERLKARAEGGADFAELAREYSDDRGTADKGGDLGWFGRGQMVEPFEEAAIAAEPGEVAGPVESPYGVHIIRVEEKETPAFDETRSTFRSRVVKRRTFAAESAFVAGLEEPAEVTVPDGAFEAARELARRPQMRLSGRAASRPLTEYDGGKLTAGEFQEYLQGRPPGFQNQVAQGDDRQVEVLLRGLTRAELLINEANERGIEISETERDSLLTQARNRVVAAGRSLGFNSVEPQPGESRDDAVDRVVLDDLRDVLSGRDQVLLLKSISSALRREFRSEVFDHAVTKVVEQVQALQPGSPDRPRIQGGSRPVTPGRSRAPNAPPDSAGG